MRVEQPNPRYAAPENTLPRGRTHNTFEIDFAARRGTEPHPPGLALLIIFALSLLSWALLAAIVMAALRLWGWH
jgi:hypothetical protein